MPLSKKGLWVEDLDGNSARVIQHIKDTGATTVCVRTTSSELQGLIPTFKQMNVKVFGWRWPHVYPNPHEANDTSVWTDEIRRMLYGLIPAGLDGYIFDIESDDGKLAQDWDNPDYKTLIPLMAQSITQIIKAAFDRRGTAYVLGMTGHQCAFSYFPGIPFQSFLNVSSVLYPQMYWQARDDNNVCQPVAPPMNDPKHPTGKPEQAVANGYGDYLPKKLPIVPLAGEISCVSAGEIARFGTAIAAHGATEAHFYVDADTFTDPGVLAAIKAL
jgi:hypothetical protein